MTRRAAAPFAAPLATVLCLLLCSLSAVAPGLAQEEAESVQAPRRVIAIGDIHGAEDAFHDILRRVGLIDGRWRWTGGRDVLVQTGDFLDRGGDAVHVAERLMELQKDAAESGGEVHVLLGNHEIMNLIGDRRDVSTRIVRALADSLSEARRAAECRQRAAFLEKVIVARGEEPPSIREISAACVATMPVGTIQYIRALAPVGHLGAWLRTLPTVLKIDGTVFVHGGVGPALVGKSIEEINHRAHRELADMDRWRLWLVKSGAMPESADLVEMMRAAMLVLEPEEPSADMPPADMPPDLARVLDIRETFLMGSDGPFWFRGYAKWDDPTGLEQMPPILDSLGAERVVVGHTPQRRGRIETRFGGGVYLIDTGMLEEVYKGRPAALVIEGGQVRALYLDGEETLWPPPSDLVGETGLETPEDP